MKIDLDVHRLVMVMYRKGLQNTSFSAFWSYYFTKEIFGRYGEADPPNKKIEE